MADQRKILVTGAGGTLGQDFLARLALFDQWEVTATRTADLDLASDPAKIQQTLSKYRPEVIINTAAFTAVDAAETETQQAQKVNARGPQALASWAKYHGTYLIHVSTDYVFDGAKGSPYEPQDKPNPINHYGKTKLAGEKAVLSEHSEGSAILRTSWLYGTNAKNFVPFILDAAEKQTPIRVAEDQWGVPTWTGTLVKMILHCLEERPAGVFHACCSGQTTRYAQAKFLCEAIGASPDFMTPVPTAEFNFPAKRPLNTVMATSFPNLATDWQTATLKFLETQGRQVSHV